MQTREISISVRFLFELGCWHEQRACSHHLEENQTVRSGASGKIGKLIHVTLCIQ